MANQRYGGVSPEAAVIIETGDQNYSVEDIEIIEERILINRIRQEHRNRSPGTKHTAIIVHEDDNSEDEGEYGDGPPTADFNNGLDVTIGDDAVIFLGSRKCLQVSAPPDRERHHQKIRRADGSLIKVNFLYEINPETAPRCSVPVQFILVMDIAENLQTGEMTVTGLPFTRSRFLEGRLHYKLNEIVSIHQLEEYDGRSPKEQAAIQIDATDIKTPRCLHMTNALFPEHRFAKHSYEVQEKVEKDGPLVWRWKYFLHYQNAQEKRNDKPCQRTLDRVRENEVKRPDLRVPEEVLRANWRGETCRGGSHICEAQAFATGQPALRQQYTVTDSFCGAGGFSRGAERAGLKVIAAVDHWDKACESYRLNFPNTRLFQMSIDDFLHENSDTHADILHLSPPCQTWSPAHTIPSPIKDEANKRALFSCKGVIEKVRPRVFTLEQTFGLSHKRHRKEFHNLIRDFTELNYSVTWKIVPLQTWGLPQKRDRLIIIGACPGEKLPPFPTATHCETGARGLPRYVTVKEALANIYTLSGEDQFKAGHSPKETWDSLPSGSVISSPNEILPRCMTTSGGGNVHWSRRPFTIREFASLQGFPTWHKFAGKQKAGEHVLVSAKRQIGNAFPPVVVKHLCEHIKNWLMVEDGFAPAKAMRSSVGGRELIFLSEGPRHNIPPPLVMPSIPDPGRSTGDAIIVTDDDQEEIKYDEDSDIEMTDAPYAASSPATPDTPNTPYTPDTWYTSRSRSRSRTMSLGGTPEPVQAGNFRNSPICID